MRLCLSRSMRTSCAIPQWLTAQVRRLAGIPSLLPLEEMAEMAQPVWRLPKGVRAAAVILSLAGLVGGVRVLDAQIAGIADSATPVSVEQGTDAAATSGTTVSPEGQSAADAAPVAEEAPPTALIVERLPQQGDTHRFMMVEVTGYTSDRRDTDANPEVTASSHKTRPGTIALSRDLLRTFTPGAPFDFGDRVLIPGMGIYVIEDTMHPRWTHKADIWFGDLATARRWGHRDVYLTQVDAGEPLLVAQGWHR